MLTFTHAIGPDVRIRFNEKPEIGVRVMLKANGFRWWPSEGLWRRRRIDGAADFLAALERKIGPRKPDGACWRCQSPEGFFRNQGPATPVYCDACHAQHTAKPWEPDRLDLEHEDRCRDACGR